MFLLTLSSDGPGRDIEADADEDVGVGTCRGKRGGKEDLGTKDGEREKKED